MPELTDFGLDRLREVFDEAIQTTDGSLDELEKMIDEDDTDSLEILLGFISVASESLAIMRENIIAIYDEEFVDPEDFMEE